MKAVTFAAPGGPEVLTWSEVDAPTAAAGEVVITVAAAGVNNADLMQREGRYRVPAGASPILGLECSGIISAIGEGVTDWAVGDRVCALLTGGSYAEQVVVPVAQLLPVPASLDLVEAAGLPEVACTVFSNLAMTAGLRAGQSVLVHGGGSGIGTFAIQWAKAIGARVFTTAGSARKLDRCRELGADVAIDYNTQDFVEEVLKESDGRGVDAILDLVGPAYLARNIQCLAPDGHLVIIGSVGNADSPTLDLGELMMRRASVSSTTLRGRPAEQKAEIVARVRAEVWPLVESGEILPVIDSVLPMDRAGDAHRLIADGAAIGKVLLTPPV